MGNYYIPTGDMNNANDTALFATVDNTKGTANTGANATVASSATTLVVSLATAQPDTNYLVFVTPQWNTDFWVTSKTVNGFTINFGTASTGSAVDWIVRR